MKLKTFEEFVNEQKVFELDFIKVHNLKPFAEIKEFLSIGENIELSYAGNEPIDATVANFDDKNIVIFANYLDNTTFSKKQETDLAKRYVHNELASLLGTLNADPNKRFQFKYLAYVNKSGNTEICSHFNYIDSKALIETTNADKLDIEDYKYLTLNSGLILKKFSGKIINKAFEEDELVYKEVIRKTEPYKPGKLHSWFYVLPTKDVFISKL